MMCHTPQPRYMRWGWWFGILIGWLPVILITALFALVIVYYSILGHGRTEYAKDFRLEKLERVEIGMTKQEVVSLLGEPLEIAREPDDPEEGLIYARQHPEWPDADYWLIRVQIDKDGKVVEVAKSRRIGD